MWELLARFIVRKSVYILIVIAMATIFVGYNSTEIRLQWSLPKMLPDNDSTLLEYEKFKDLYGQNQQVLLLAMEENPLDNIELFNSWYRFGGELEQINGVDTVVSINRLFNIVKDTTNKRFELVKIIDQEVKTQTELDSVKALIYSLPFYKGLIYNDSNHINLMLVTLDSAKFNSKLREPLVREVFDDVTHYMDENDVTIHYSGMPFIRTQITHLVKRELSLFLGYVVIIMVIILLIFFRSLSPVLVSMLIVALGVTWSFGIIAFLDYEITVLTGIIPPLVIVIGIPNSIYLINRYHSEYALHQNKVLAISRVVRKIGQATLMTNVTTAVGFLAFVFTESTILVEFGIVAFLNIMILLCIFQNLIHLKKS